MSNQKYKEFKEKFPEISFGILTGDIKCNPEADVLIMTTEILRNTLYLKLSDDGDLGNPQKPLDFNMDIDNDLACVVFDEVHYINDAGRGKVWEETIMMLPTHIQMVMLSATIDKPERFAQWIEDTQNNAKQVVLTGTSERIVPLVHYTYFTAPEKTPRNIKDKTVCNIFNQNIGKLKNITPLPNSSPHTRHQPLFNEKSIIDARKMERYMYTNKIHVKRSFVINSLIQHLYNLEYLPAICFVFSRKQCETMASEIKISLFEKGSTVPQTIAQECRQIIMKISNYNEYINLPEYLFMIKLLEKGIAIHHSGIMPVLREMVEILFAKGYVKLLFATETFAVGINMPTKTVVFTGFSKFDGHDMRLMLPHEYTQMAGRAGRRGLDTIGHVIHCLNIFDVPDIVDYKHMLNGKPQTLRSKFSISYPVMLNIIHMNTVSIHTHICKSMMHSELQAELTSVQQMIDDYNKQIVLAWGGYDMENNTDKQSCLHYMELQTLAVKGNQKYRKKLQSEISTMEAQFQHIQRDVVKIKKIIDIESDRDKERLYIDDLNSYINKQIEKTSQILINRKFIKYENSSLKLTYTGQIANSIQELHSLVFADIFTEFNQFDNLSSIELIMLFSCFTNITVKGELRCDNDTSRINPITSAVMNKINDYPDFDSEHSFHFDLISDIELWVNATEESQCKQIILNLQANKELFLGEFIKAILKINSISNELIKIAETFNYITLLHKLQNIAELTLKFIATNNSLYCA